MDKERLIQKHFRGELSEAESRLFAQYMEEQDFVYMVTEYDMMKTVAGHLEKEKLKKQLQKIDSSDRTNRMKIWYIIATIILLVGIYLLLPKTESYERYYAEYIEVFPNMESPSVRGKNDYNKISIIYNLYGEGNYNKCIESITAIESTKRDESMTFYKAMSLLNLSKFSDAKDVLLSIKDKTSKYNEETYWYLALVYLREGDIENTKNILSEMNQYNMLFNSEKREALMQRLGN